MATVPTITDGVTSVTFATMIGLPLPFGEEVEAITRPNVDGMAARKRGDKSRPRNIRTVEDLATVAAVKTRLETYRGLIGAVVTLSDSFLNDWTNAIVMDVRLIRSAKLLASVGGIQGSAAAAMIEVEWTIQLAEVPS